MTSHRWQILTGEYPPVAGGVADYTRLLARALAAAGDHVEVWAPGGAASDPGVIVHSLQDLGPRSLARLERALARGNGGRLLVQYAPHALGLRGVNLPLSAWLSLWRRPAPWVMFHEVHYPRIAGAPWRHQALALGQEGMAALVTRAAERVFISTEVWRPVLARLAPHATASVWLPVPSNLPEHVSAEAASAARAAIGVGPDEALIGHFGTHGAWTFERLLEVLPPLVGRKNRRALLLGRRGSEAAMRLVEAAPELTGRVVAREGAADELAALLAACDLVLQPYVDGPTGKRGTLMAALALGRPVVTNEGSLTEPSFRGAPFLRLVPDGSAILRAAEDLLADPGARRELGQAARETYVQRFALARTVEVLRRLAEEQACASP